MRSLARYLVALFAVLTLGASMNAMAAVTASLDRNQIAPDETVQLLLQREGSSSGQPDLGKLKRDFDIVATSRGSSVRIINGQVNSNTEIKLTLAPKHEGTIQIPPVQWDGEQSAALTLTVGGPGNANGSGGNAQAPDTAAPDAAAAPANAHVFLTATLDRPQTYVQAATVLTVLIHTDETLYQASLDLPGNTDVIVKPLGKDVQSQESRDGRNYQVIERKYLLFPQRSGQLKLDGAVLNAQVADANSNDPFGDDSFFGNAFGHLPSMLQSTRPLRLHGRPVELKVLPRPASATGTTWLPAQALTLTEEWHPDNASIHVGEPLTRQLHLTATGLTGAQLPDLGALMAVPEGFKAYPDKAQLNDTAQGNTVLGRRDQAIALIASHAGRYTLPALKLDWWNTEQGREEHVVLPERTLEILPAVAGSNSNPATPAATMTPPPAQTSTPTTTPAPIDLRVPVPATTTVGPWVWVSLAFALLWVFTLLAWWRSRRQQRSDTTIGLSNQPAAGTEPARPAISTDKAAKAFADACRNNDPQAARIALLNWASATWPEQAAIGLHDIARLLDDPHHEQALRALNRACYTDTAWDGASLRQLALRRPRKATVTARATPLPELYP